MLYTPNLNLNIPEYSDKASIREALQKNLTVLDELIKALQEENDRLKAELLPYILFNADSSHYFGKGGTGAKSTGFANNAFGYGALTKSTGVGNSAFGHLSLSNNTTANHNTGIGNSALSTNTTGNYNTAVGASA